MSTWRRLRVAGILALATAGPAVAVAAGDEPPSGAFPPSAVTPADPSAPTKVYAVPASSMAPTIAVGTLVRAQLYPDPRRARPALGDLVVTHPPRGADPDSAGIAADRSPAAVSGIRCGVRDALRRGRPCPRSVGGRWRSEAYLDRVVGGPGDRIAIRRGRVIRNGSPADEPFLGASCRRSRRIGVCNLPHAVVVPAGQYFVLGDNRGAASDSRLWGPVRRAWLIGFVVAVGVEYPRSALPLG